MLIFDEMIQNKRREILVGSNANFLRRFSWAKTRKKMSFLIAFLWLSLICFSQQQSGKDGPSKTLFYFREGKENTPGFLKQLRTDVVTSLTRLKTQQEADKGNPTSPDALSRALSLALGARIAEMNCHECENSHCKEFESLLSDPCVSITYETESSMCKVAYTC
jgi:hypothetical protein